MQSFQFRCMNGDLITVQADSEGKARHFAMYGGWYNGKGLTLVEQK